MSRTSFKIQHYLKTLCSTVTTFFLYQITLLHLKYKRGLRTYSSIKFHKLHTQTHMQNYYKASTQ